MIEIIEDRVLNLSTGPFRILRWQCLECSNIWISNDGTLEPFYLECQFCDGSPKAYPYRRIKTTS